MTKLIYSFLGGACASALAMPALAQDAASQQPPSMPATKAETGVDDIVVTALRRSEKLQDVPVSITALTGNMLANQRIQQVSDLAGSVPNLQASPAGGDSLPIFSLRGISMSDFSGNQQGPVATYFDEVYKGSYALLPLGMYDLERVEILRGPQGTLYGKNTTGGAINFISRKPRYETEAYLKIGYGNYSRIDADGAVQTALGDKAAARIAFTFSRADGWYKNELAGRSDPNAVRQYGVRASFLVEPSDKLDFVLRLSTSLVNPITYGILAKPGPDGVGNGVYELFGSGSSYFRTGLGGREIESNAADRYRQRLYSASLTGNWHLSDGLTVTSVTSYDRGKVLLPEDTDGSPTQTLEAEYRVRAKQFAQDLRLASDLGGPFNFIFGAYYNVETVRAGTTYHYYNDLDVNGDGNVDANDCLDPNSGFLLACTYRNDYKQIKRTVAVYSDVNYQLSDRLILRGGLRYTRDRGTLKEYTGQILGADGTPIANTVPGDPVDFNAVAPPLRFRKGTVTGKAGIDFKTADGNLIYASYSRGYRGQSFNAQAFFSPAELNVARPETVNAYELGFKSQFFRRAVTLNGALFYYDYRNQQALDVEGGTNRQTLINVPKSRVLGGELELSARPIDGLRINAGLGLLDTKIRRGVLRGRSLEGNKLPNAPKVTLSAGFEWDVIHGGGDTLTLGMNGSYTSKQYYDLFNTDRIAQRGYVLVNGQLSYRFADDRFGVSVWAKNIFDRHYKRYALDLTESFGFDYLHMGDPRSFGATLDAKF